MKRNWSAYWHIIFDYNTRIHSNKAFSTKVSETFFTTSFLWSAGWRHTIFFFMGSQNRFQLLTWYILDLLFPGAATPWSSLGSITLIKWYTGWSMLPYDIRITRIQYVDILLLFLFITVHVVRLEQLPLLTTPRANEFSMTGYRWATFPRSWLDRVVLFPQAK